MNFVKNNPDGTKSIINMNNSEEIEKYVNREYKEPHSYRFDGWDAKLFSKQQDEIITFLIDRFENTTNPMEWIVLLPYLKKIVGDRKLFTPFEERNISVGGILTPTFSESIEQIQGKPIELNINRYNSVENMKQTVLEI
jgi:hypothetical protein